MYEIGDDVIYQGADKSAYKRRGVVASIEEKDGKPQLTVALEDGEEFTAPIDDWSRAFTNSRSCNATNPNVRNAINASAKIVTTGNFGTLKVGDRVDFRKSRYWRGTGVVTKVYGDGIIDVKGDNGEGEMEIHEEDIMNSRVRTTNATVRNALNARTAKNSVTIMKDSRKSNGWISGTVRGFQFEAKVFDEGSDFGIDKGRVSKLWMRNGKEIVIYERGWSDKPKSQEAKAAYTELLAKLENLPKVENAAAKNATVRAQNSESAVGRNADFSMTAKKVSREADRYVQDCNAVAKAIRSLPSGADRDPKAKSLMPTIKRLYRDGATDDIINPLTAVEQYPTETQIRLSIERRIGEGRRVLWGALKDAGLLAAASNSAVSVRTTNATVHNALNARTAKNSVARNYSRDTESFAVRNRFETKLGIIVQKFLSDISSVGSKAKSEFLRLQKSDPDNAFWVGEVQGWVDGLKEAVEDVW